MIALKLFKYVPNNDETGSTSGYHQSLPSSMRATTASSALGIFSSPIIPKNSQYPDPVINNHFIVMHGLTTRL